MGRAGGGGAVGGSYLTLSDGAAMTMPPRDANEYKEGENGTEDGPEAVSVRGRRGAGETDRGGRGRLPTGATTATTAA